MFLNTEVSIDILNCIIVFTYVSFHVNLTAHSPPHYDTGEY